MTDKMRLDKLLAQRGVGSRSMVRKLIRRGQVTVDGEVAQRPEMSVDAAMAICVDDQVIDAPPLVVIWHKPIGVVSTMRDPHGRHDLSDALPAQYREHLHPVGRLDAETTGLLLFSRSGSLTQWLLHPKRAIQRRYEAGVEVDVASTLKETLANGVATSLGTFTADVEYSAGRTVRLGVREGKHRMVRRLLANSGHPVESLHRLSYGPFQLGELPVSECRIATDDELKWLAENQAPLDN